MAWVRCCGGGAPIPVNTPLGDLTGNYGSNETKTSAIQVPKILSGQVLRIVGKNNTSITYNYSFSVYFSTDNANWTLLYTSGNIPFPTSGADTTIDVALTNVLGNRGYFRITFSGQSGATNMIRSAVVGTFS